jgi:hypothetical protein
MTPPLFSFPQASVSKECGEYLQRKRFHRFLNRVIIAWTSWTPEWACLCLPLFSTESLEFIKDVLKDRSWDADSLITFPYLSYYSLAIRELDNVAVILKATYYIWAIASRRASVTIIIWVLS